MTNVGDFLFHTPLKNATFIIIGTQTFVLYIWLKFFVSYGFVCADRSIIKVLLWDEWHSTGIFRCNALANFLNLKKYDYEMTFYYRYASTLLGFNSTAFLYL